jgi:hypothetical protein
LTAGVGERAAVLASAGGEEGTKLAASSPAVLAAVFVDVFVTETRLLGEEARATLASSTLMLLTVPVAASFEAFVRGATTPLAPDSRPEVGRR